MNVNYQICKPLFGENQYQRYIRKQHDSQITLKKKLFYEELLKLAQQRYPKQFLLQLQQEIQPFEDSIDTFKQTIQQKYSDIPKDALNECLQYIFHKKLRETVENKKDHRVAEDKSQFMRNRWKIYKEDFTYDFDLQKDATDSGPPITTSRNDISHESLQNKSSRGQKTKRSGKSNLDSPPLSPIIVVKKIQSKNPTQLSFSQRRKKTIDVNQKYDNGSKNRQIIQENDSKDLVRKQQTPKKVGITDRSVKSGFNNESFSNFKNQDIMVPIDGRIQTERTDLEELMRFLSQSCENIEQINSLSERGINLMKMYKNNMENLYTTQRGIKIDAVKRAVNRLKVQYN